MSERFDVVIVGAGTAGLAALREVRRQTESFLLINDGPCGTTCARVGCMPSKALIEVANAFHRRRAFHDMGIVGADRLCVDRSAVLRRVRALRDGFVSGVLKLTESLGARSIRGRARFLEPDVLEVDGRRVRAQRVIVATGSRPVMPEAWQALGPRVLTSDTLFEQETLPERMAVVGLGGIGAEMAQALSRLDVRVSGFDLGGRIAGLTDPVINEEAKTALKQEIDLHLGTHVELQEDGDAIRVRAGDISIVVDKVLAALGRRPNIDGIGFERLGVQLDPIGMPPVNPQTMQIGDLPVFLAGDANAYVPLMHEAADEGYIAAYNVLRERPECFVRRTPLTIVFTDPNVAIVGRSFASLRSEELSIGEIDLKGQPRLRMAGEDLGRIRIYADRHIGVLLGAELCAPHGEHLAHLLASAIREGQTARECLRMPFYHPVVEEALRSALRDIADALPGVRSPDLATCERIGARALE